MEIPRLTADQFQALAEYITAQCAAAVLEHEARIHAPNNPEARDAVKKINDVRKQLLEICRTRLVRH